MQLAPITLQHRLDPEDQARADCYALLAALFRDAPDARLLVALSESPRLPESAATPLAVAYNRMLDASAAMDPDAARQEYLDLFVGVGKSEVDLHAAHWRNEPGSHRSLVRLREDLARLGLARQPESSLYEDHFAALCETMRILVAGLGERRPATLAAQRAFFEAHLGGWTDVFCAAIRACPLANYYVRVAEFISLYMAVERDSLAME